MSSVNTSTGISTADCSRLGDRSLDDVLASSEKADKATQKLPNICLTVRRITRAFGAAFVLGAIVALRGLF